MNGLLVELEARLEALEQEGLRRRLAFPRGLDFSSNDYLGLAADPGLRREVLARLAADDPPLGAPASRLLRGNDRRHEALEARLARFKGTEAALLFASGYQANVAVLTALVGAGDRVLSDALNHASLIDGIRLTRARRVIFPHRDAAAVERALAETTSGGRTFLVTESLFSMEGDLAPLARYADLCERHGAHLLVDDAHATGVFGDRRGSGLTEVTAVEKRAVAVVSTFGKAFGLAGAFVAGPRQVIDYLVNRARPFVFSTAPPPLLVAAWEAALDRVEGEPERRRRVLARAERLRRRLRRAGFAAVPGTGPIVPVPVGDDRAVLAVREELRARGFDVSAVRPPTVPAGTARLRISVHADHDEEAIDRLAEAVAAALAAAGAGVVR